MGFTQTKQFKISIQKQLLLLLITALDKKKQFIFNSKTTFVTVNPMNEGRKPVNILYSKTTFVTVNPCTEVKSY